jgi:hypothetical protein
MEVDVDLCGVIYPKDARHNGLLCGRKPNDVALSIAHKTPLCWITPHTTTGVADNAMLNYASARLAQAATAPAACERRALDGVAAICGAMKCEVVKRLR